MNTISYGIIKISGSDAETFLQGQLTLDLNAMNESNLAAHCNAKGRVLSLFHIGKKADDFYLILPSNMTELALKNLRKYSVFFKCNLTDESNQLRCIQHDASISDNVLTSIQIDSERLIDIIESNKNSDFDVSWSLQNITNKLPIIYPETSAKFLPHELNLDKLGAVSFSKGCFTGQEIIARIHYRSAISKVLQVVTFATQESIPRGSDVFYFKNNTKIICGNVIDLCESSYNNYKALITIDHKNQKDALFLGENTNLNREYY